MEFTTKRAGMIVAIALIISIITQIVYMATLGGPQASDPAQGVTNADLASYLTDRWNDIAMVWMTELVAFTAVSVAALTALLRGAPARTAWIFLLFAGLFNMIQISFGLSMFAPAGTAGEALSPVFTTVMSGAFFFYFLAKSLLGLAGIGFGLALIGESSATTKAIAGLSILVGLAAVIANLMALPQGLTLVFEAGAAGTAAALTTGLAAMLVARRAA